MEIELNKESIKAALQAGVHAVTFTKKDGTIREMIASLCPVDIPSEHTPKGTGVTSFHEDAPLRVYDVANEGWRSINIDTVTSVVPFIYA